MARKLKIVGPDERIASYNGKLLVFNLDDQQMSGVSEQDRAQMILELINRNASNGPFRLVEAE